MADEVVAIRVTAAQRAFLERTVRRFRRYGKTRLFGYPAQICRAVYDALPVSDE